MDNPVVGVMQIWGITRAQLQTIISKVDQLKDLYSLFKDLIQKFGNWCQKRKDDFSLFDALSKWLSLSVVLARA